MKPSEEIAAAKQQIYELPGDVGQDQINETAKTLREMSYEPTLTVSAPDFLTMTKNDVLALIDKVAAEKGDDLHHDHLSLLTYHYSLLQRLRVDEPEAWDVINELMEDD